MDDRQRARLSDLISAADAVARSIEPGAPDVPYDEYRRLNGALERAYAAWQLERFAPPEALVAATALRSALLDARSCHILAELDAMRGRPTDMGARHTEALEAAKAARAQLAACLEAEAR